MLNEAIDFTDKIKNLSGVQSVILMDNKAWGESYDDSNLNLVVLYRKKDAKTVKRIDSEAPAKFNLTHIDFNELKDGPKFLNILSDGIILYGRPLMVKAEDVYLKARMIVSYDTSKLKQGERSRLNRALYGGISTYQKDGKRIKKQYSGLVEQIGAKKVGKAVLIVNRLNAPQITQTLERFGADWNKIPIWGY